MSRLVRLLVTVLPVIAALAISSVCAQTVPSWLVKDRSLSAPPGSPAIGDRYIVGPAPTGAWAGHVNDITVWDGTQWAFADAQEGLSAWVQDEPVHVLYFDGSNWASNLPTILPPVYGNFIRNPSFSVWQAGTSFVATTYGPDLWKQTTAAGRTFSRQAGFSGARYSYRIQRDSGNAGTTPINIGYVLSTELSTQLAGKQVILSADVRAGANFSGTTLLGIITSGTGIDETYALGSATFPTGSASGSVSPSLIPSTTAQRITWGPTTLASGATEVGFRLSFSPTGTAGAADYYEITNVKLETGSTATSFEPESFAVTMAAALRLYRKSFLDATTPAQNAGAGSGEHRFPATVAGANPNRLGSIRFDQPMRAIPSITLFNPAAANGQIRDLTAGADLSASTAANISDKGFEITGTGNAGTVVGNDLGVHWVADARAF